VSGENLEGVEGVYARRGSVESDGETFPVYCRETEVGHLCVNAVRIRVTDTSGNEVHLKISLLRWYPINVGWGSSYSAGGANAFSLAMSMAGNYYGSRNSAAWGERADCEAYYLPPTQQWITAASLSQGTYSSLVIQYPPWAQEMFVSPTPLTNDVANHTMADVITTQQLGVLANAPAVDAINITAVPFPTLT